MKEKISNVVSTGLEGIKRVVSPNRKGTPKKDTGKDLRTRK